MEVRRWIVGETLSVVKSEYFICPICSRNQYVSYYRCNACNIEGWEELAHKPNNFTTTYCTGQLVPDGLPRFTGGTDSYRHQYRVQCRTCNGTRC